MISLGIDIGGSSVKAAALRDGDLLWTGKSALYDRPRFDQLAAAVADASTDLTESVDAIGLCIPGLLDENRERVLASANLPSLENQLFADLLGNRLGFSDLRAVVVNDANAAAHDLFCTTRPRGRLLVIAIGTGVGAAVLDEGRPLRVDGDSPGHIGQIDISLEGEDRIAPDGGRGGLEAYLRATALRCEYGEDPASKIRAGHPAFRALARTIRICHALYRPHHIILAGGVGIRLARLLPELREAIERDLTRLARPGWTLSTGNSDFHSAIGAARLAAKAANESPSTTGQSGAP